MLNAASLKKFQNAVERNSDLKNVLNELYPSYVESYFKFRKKVGAHCAFCRASAKFMFLSEVNRNYNDFMNRFEQNNWDGYSL